MEQSEYYLEEKFDKFLGREEELEIFQNQFELYKEEWEEAIFKEDETERRAYVLDIYGIGGVGKTTLLKKMNDMIKENYILNP